MNNAAPVGFCEAFANLARNLKRFLGGKSATTLQIGREGLSVQELHGEKIHIASFSVPSVDFIYPANIRMAYCQRTSDFR